MKARTVGAAFLVAVAAASAWFGVRGRRPAPVTRLVVIHDMAFDPDTLEANPGDTVVWLNRDLFPHTVTAADSSWGSPPLAEGERWTRIVVAGGVPDYGCRFHPTMTGRVASGGAP